MPRIIKDGQVVEDQWQGELLSPDDYSDATASPRTAVILEADQPPSLIEGDLSALPMVVIHFPVFTDGRCFSYARELRERGFQGEIRATGEFTRDQLFYLQRCGFNAFQFAPDIDLDEAVKSLSDFSDAYQASVDQPEPLFLRR
jgi:uncharacterized protein (DUF934 family)